MHIPIYDRVKKITDQEPVYGSAFLNVLYPRDSTLQILVWPLLQFITRLPWLSHLYGWMQNQPRSKKKIAPFIASYGVDASEFQTNDFSSFNDFFTRHLKKGARPIGSGIIAPADGRYRFIPEIGKEEGIYAKGQKMNLERLLGCSHLARRFDKGALVIARLAPPDYHRYHYPIDGEAKKPKKICGPLFSVNPRSLMQNIAHITENKRFITEVAWEGGSMLFIEIGATFVGSIHHTREGSIEKGEEKGFFSFGGSAVMLLFEPGKIIFEPDLFEGPEGLEVRCLMGQTIARLK